MARTVSPPKYCRWVVGDIKYSCLTLKKRFKRPLYEIIYDDANNPKKYPDNVVNIVFVRLEIYPNAPTKAQPSMLKFIEDYQKFMVASKEDRAPH